MDSRRGRELVRVRLILALLLSRRNRTFQASSEWVNNTELDVNSAESAAAAAARAAAVVSPATAASCGMVTMEPYASPPRRVHAGRRRLRVVVFHASESERVGVVTTTPSRDAAPSRHGVTVRITQTDSEIRYGHRRRRRDWPDPGRCPSLPP
jgi:hypothetical protein